MIIINIKSMFSDKFKKDERGATMVTAILGLAVGLLIGVLILASIQGPMETAIDNLNNSAASAAATTVVTLAWAGLGLLAVVIIVLVGKYMLQIVQGM